MKKLTLTVASLLAGSTLFAQSNESKAVENGNFNRSLVTQSGTHKSNILQNSSALSVADENLTTVNQSNISAYNIFGSKSNVEQNGKSHISSITQIGNNNLDVYIGSDGTTPSANVDNETRAIQYGNLNNGKQVIRGASANQSLLTLDQGGNDNNSNQTASWAVSSKGAVVQTGNSNDVWQQVDGTRDEASTVQIGDDNYSYQWIENGNSHDNKNTVLQTGNNNISRVVTSGEDNKFNLLQIGKSNKLVGITGGIYTNAIQSGSANNAVLTQAGDNNEVWLEQTGDRNSIKGTSVAGAHQLGNFNKSVFDQDGDDNTIVSKQFGHHNSEIVTQTGDSHVSTVKQLGNNNSFLTNQGNTP